MPDKETRSWHRNPGNALHQHVLSKQILQHQSTECLNAPFLACQQALATHYLLLLEWHELSPCVISPKKHFCSKGKAIVVQYDTQLTYLVSIPVGIPKGDTIPWLSICHCKNCRSVLDAPFVTGMLTRSSMPIPSLEKRNDGCFACTFSSQTLCLNYISPDHIRRCLLWTLRHKPALASAMI